MPVRLARLLVAVVTAALIVSPVQPQTAGAAMPAAGPQRLVDDDGYQAFYPPVPPGANATAPFELTAVDCGGVGFCVSAGYYYADRAPERFVTLSGGVAASEPMPAPAGGVHPRVKDIECVSSSACTAIGTFTSTIDPTGVHSMVLSYRSGVWTAARIPKPTGLPAAVLDLVNISCAQADQCVAVGSYQLSQRTRPLVVEIAGSAITTHTVGLPAGFDDGHTRLVGVSCSPGGFCPAVGTHSGAVVSGIIATDADGAWAAVRPPANSQVPESRGVLTDVDCPADNDCVAVGAVTRTGGDAGVAITWNGSTWTPSTLPNSIDGSALPAGYQTGAFGLSCAPDGLCTAVYSLYSYTYGQSYALLSRVQGQWRASSFALPPDAHDIRNPTLPGPTSCVIGGCTAIGRYLDDSHTSQIFLSTFENGVWTSRRAAVPVAGGYSEMAVNGFVCVAVAQCTAVTTNITTNISTSSVILTAEPVSNPGPIVAMAPVIEAAEWPTEVSRVKAGDVIQADAGVWAPTPVTLSYQWLAGGKPIDGATDRTLTVPVLAAGTTVTVTVTGTRDGAVSASASSPKAVPVRKHYYPTPIEITGTAQIGQTLTAVYEPWTPVPKEMYLRWFAGSLPVGSGPTLLVTGEMAGLPIRVVANQNDGDFDDEFDRPTSTSPDTVPVPFGVINSVAPRIVGTLAVGAEVAADTGDVPPFSVAHDYQWAVDGEPVPGATSASFVIPSSALGARISVTVSAHAVGYVPETKTSADSAVVQPGTVIATWLKVTGTRKVNSTLTAVANWGPYGLSIKYQWNRDGAVIPGATGKTYRIPPAAVGTMITVTATASLTGYTGYRETSAVAKEVAPASLTTITPKISGSAKVGSTLKATAGWKPAPIAYRYQWKQNGHPIPGAVSRTYKVPKTLVGKKISVSMTGSKLGYATVVRASASTRAVQPR